MFGEILLSLFLSAVATIVMIDVSAYPTFKTMPVGPDLFPSILAYVLYGIAAFVLLKQLYLIFIKKTTADGESYVSSEREKAKKTLGMLKTRYKDVLGTVGVVVFMMLYAALLKPIGFEIATLLFVVCVMLCCGERSPLKLVLVPIISTAVILLLFKVGLNVALPLKILTML